MITIKLKGGLGNQMFEYAYGRSLSITRKEKLVLDLHYLKFPYSGDTKREFTLDKFNIQAETKTPGRDSRMVKLLDKIKAKITRNYGFYMSEKYFSDIPDIIRQEFTLKSPLSAKSLSCQDKIRNTKDSISIHIRRSDYIQSKVASKALGALPLEYYYKAIGLVKTKITNPCFFIFSDDIEWAKNNLHLDFPTIFVSDPDIPDYEELILMSNCRHHIIANSSFSWWGAWLNPNQEKIVIAPKNWSKDSSIDSNKIVPKSWFKI